MHFMHLTAITMDVHMSTNTKRTDFSAPFIVVMLTHGIIVVCIVSHGMIKSVHKEICMIMLLKQIINLP